MMFTRENLVALATHLLNSSGLALLMAAMIALAVPGHAQELFSGLTGTVADPSGGALPGATVTVTNNETHRTITVVTGADGVFFARDLDPGRYTVRVELSGFTPREMSDVNLLLGRTLKIDATLQLPGVQEQVSVVGAAPLLDMTTTARGHNIPAEEFDVLPKGRSFQSLAFTAPSVNSGDLEGGLQVNGASAGENNFTVDGVSVNSQIHGNQRQDAVFEYLQEVQVKTTGISAEYGGALGGVISAVTKSGGDQFRGSVFDYFSGSSFLTSDNNLGKRLQIDPLTQNTARVIQDDDQSYTRNEPGLTVGGPIVRSRLFFFGSAAPRFERQTRNYRLAEGATGSIKRERNLWSTFGKLTYQPSGKLRVSASTLYTPDHTTGKLVAYDQFAANQSTLTPENIAARNNLGWKTPQLNVSGVADYTLNGTTVLSFRAGVMRDDYIDTGIDTSQTYEYSTSSIGLAGVPQQFQRAAGFSNLPRTQFSDHDLTTRHFYDLDVAKALNAWGQHTLKVGAGFLRASNDVQVAFPNQGYVTVFWNQAFTSNVTGITDRGTYGYYTIDDIGTIGKTSGDIWHLYVQDDWAVTRRLTLNLGVRTENEKIPTFRPEIQKYAIEYGWGDKLAPRLGLAYDLRGDGRVKLSAAYGRYFDWTKYELVRGSFGGDVWRTRYRSLDTPDPTQLTFATLPGRNLWTTDSGDSFQDHRVPSFGEESIDPNIKPMSQDAFNGGVEYQVSPSTVFGANFVHTNLLRTIEDLGVVVNGNEVYIYGNPGEGLAAVTPTTGLTAPFNTPKAKRNYNALELTFNRRMSNSWFAGGSYVLSRLTGNYPGTVNTDEVVAPGRVYIGSQEALGQVTRPGSNATRAWDLDELMFDAHGNLGVDGVLPTDRTHVFKLYGSYMFHFGTTAGLNFLGGSGTPVSTSVYTSNQIPVLVEGRGDLGRTAFLTQTDVFVSHDLKLGGEKRLRVELNVQNLFNQQQERHRVQFVNRVGADGRRLISSAINLSQVDLTQGYDYQTMLTNTIDAQKAPGTPVSGYQDPRFNQPDVWNPGIQGRLSIRFMF
jgi:outer membrane receptor protein involved in Fe transport